MGDAGKLRRRDRALIAKDWTGTEELAPASLPALPAERDAAVIDTPLDTATAWPIAGRTSWRSKRWMLLVVLFLALAAPVFFWARYQSQHVMSKNAAVRGHLAEIGTRLTGLVSKVEVDVGDRVVAGQVLVRMENRHLAAEVQEARAEVKGLERSIEVERLYIAHQRRRTAQEEQGAAAKLAAANAHTEAARIRSDEARRDYELRESLFSRDGVVSGEDVRDAETRRRTAEAGLDEARANSAAAKSAGQAARLAGDEITIRERSLGVLEADLLRAQARLTRAEADLDGATVRAPEDGAIVRRIVQPGGSIEAGQPILSMWLGRNVWVEAWIDENDIGSVRLGSHATVTFHSFPGRDFAGVVDKIGLATDLEMPDVPVPQPRSSRMRGAPVVGVQIRLDDPPLELLPGLSAVVAIRKAE